MTQAEFDELARREIAKKETTHSYSNPADNAYIEAQILEEQGLGVSQLIREIKRKNNDKKIIRNRT